MPGTYAIGIDFGGTHTRVGLISVDDGAGKAKILAKTEFPTKEAARPEAFTEVAAAEIRALLKRANVDLPHLRGVGIGAPGSVDVSKGLVHHLPNVKGWKNVPLAAEMRRRLDTKIIVDNDANAMAWGEYLFGAARGAKSAVFITLGTGLGGGFVTGGALFRGARFSAFEIGHLRYGASGQVCACGARGCIETHVGSGFLLWKIREDLLRGAKTILRNLTALPGKELTLELATQAARQRDRYAMHFWKDVGTVLGDYLAGICNLLNPEILVVGGGVAQAGPFLLDPLRKELHQNAFPEAAKVKVVPAHFGPDAGMLGAAALVLEQNK